MLAARDMGRFEDLYRDHFDRLLAFCRATMADRAGAEDAAQEAFLRAYRYGASLDPSRPSWPWLKAIARNVIAERGARAAREVAMDLPDTAVSDEEGTEVALALSGAMTSLPPRQRLALHMRYVLGWEPRQAAEVLHLSVAGFNQLVFRARSRLRSELRRLGQAVPAFVTLRIGRLRDRVRRLALGAPTGADAVMQLGAGLLALAIATGGAGPAPAVTRAASTEEVARVVSVPVKERAPRIAGERPAAAQAAKVAAGGTFAEQHGALETGTQASSAAAQAPASGGDAASGPGTPTDIVGGISHTAEEADNKRGPKPIQVAPGLLPEAPEPVQDVIDEAPDVPLPDIETPDLPDKINP